MPVKQSNRLDCVMECRTRMEQHWPPACHYQPRACPTPAGDASGRHECGRPRYRARRIRAMFCSDHREQRGSPGHTARKRRRLPTTPGEEVRRFLCVRGRLPAGSGCRCPTRCGRKGGCGESPAASLFCDTILRKAPF
jgi:hypothetical protein